MNEKDKQTVTEKNKRIEIQRKTRKNTFFNSKTFAAKLFLKLTENTIDPIIPCISILKFEPQNRNNEEIKKTLPWLISLEKFNYFMFLKEEENSYKKLLMEFAWVLFYKYSPKNYIIKRPNEKINLFFLILNGSCAELNLIIKNECLTEEEYIKHLIKMNILKEKEIIKRCLLYNKKELNIENIESIHKFCKLNNFDYEKLRYLAKKDLIDLGYNLDKIDIVPSINNYIKASIVDNEIKKKSIENTRKKYFQIPHYEYNSIINNGRFIGNLSLDCLQDDYKTYISLENSDISFIDKKEYKNGRVFPMIKNKMKNILKDIYQNFFIFNSLKQNYFIDNYAYFFIYKTYEKGQKIFAQNSIFSGIYLLKKGEITISTKRKIDELNALIILLQNSLNGFNEYISNLKDFQIGNNNLNLSNPLFQSKEYMNDIKGIKEIILDKINNMEIFGLNDCYNYKNDIYHFDAICTSDYAEVYYIPKNIFNFIVYKESTVQTAVTKIVELRSSLYMGVLNNFTLSIAKNVAFKIGKVHLINSLFNSNNNVGNNSQRNFNYNNGNNKVFNRSSIKRKPIKIYDNEKKENNLKESQTSQFSITNTKDAKNKIKKYEINKIQFGLEKEDKENLNKEQQILYNEAENNLQQFYAPQGNEINQLQTVMGNILFKLKNIFLNIDLNSNKDEQENILLNGNLKKMINYEINAHKTTMYSERFCILYPKMLKYYKSKVQFLKNLKPLCVLPVNQISAVNIAKPKKSKNKIYHLIICNKLGIKKNINNNVFLNLFDSTEINDYLSSPDLNESLLIFTSDDEQNIYKWYIIIQYLIEFINSKN